MLRNVADELTALREERAFEVFPGVRPVLGELARRVMRLGLCSIWDWDLARHLERNGIASAFDAVVCSAQVGDRKPHPVIFDLVLRRLAGAPRDAVFVGDSWHDDVAGAASAGLRPVHMAALAPCEVADHGAVPCVGDLSELSAVIDALLAPGVVDGV